MWSDVTKVQVLFSCFSLLFPPLIRWLLLGFTVYPGCVVTALLGFVLENVDRKRERKIDWVILRDQNQGSA